MDGNVHMRVCVNMYTSAFAHGSGVCVNVHSSGTRTARIGSHASTSASTSALDLINIELWYGADVVEGALGELGGDAGSGFHVPDLGALSSRHG